MASGIPNEIRNDSSNYSIEGDDRTQETSDLGSISQTLFSSSDFTAPSLDGRITLDSLFPDEDLFFACLFCDVIETSPVEVSERDQLTELLRNWNPHCSEEEKTEVEQVLIRCFEERADSLIIQSDEIKTLPDVFSLSGFKNIKVLSLFCNDLTELPDSVENLTALEHFAVTRCHSISTIPECIGNSTRLRVIEFEDCELIQSLIESLGDLPALEEFIILNCESLNSLSLNFSAMKALKKLDISNIEALESLAENIGEATTLVEIEIEDCPALQLLPESIGNLVNLETLVVKKCVSLAQFPENLGNLKALKTLNLADCESLDYIPDSIGGCEALVWIELEHTAIETLPESIGNLSSLRLLGLDGTYSLRELPDSVGNLRVVETIQLFSSTLRTLPRTIGNLSTLRELDLRDAGSLLALPQEIFNLSSECEINLDDGIIPSGILATVESAIGVEGYHGPRFNLPLPRSQHFLLSPLEQRISYTFLKAQMEVVPLFNLLNLKASEKEQIERWLHRMNDTKDSHSPLRAVYFGAIVNYLKLADKNPDYRALFLQILADASITCGDRVSLSVLHLGIAARKLTCDRANLKAYAELLRGLLALNLLEDVARQKIEVLRILATHAIDEIEVFLAYPVKLKSALNLPIDVEEMLYFRCSGITEEDLEAAKEYVLSSIGSQEALLAQLVKNDDWIAALKAQYPADYELIEEAKYAALEAESLALESGSKSKYFLIVEAYHKALIDLSIKALS